MTRYEYDMLGRIHKEIQGETILVREYDLLDRIFEERIEDISGNP